jgi:hypothetical protein
MFHYYLDLKGKCNVKIKKIKLNKLKKIVTDYKNTGIFSVREKIEVTNHRDFSVKNLYRSLENKRRNILIKVKVN